MVEGARLEIVYTATYRGFESLSLRHPTSSFERYATDLKVKMSTEFSSGRHRLEPSNFPYFHIINASKNIEYIGKTLSQFLHNYLGFYLTSNKD